MSLFVIFLNFLRWNLNTKKVGFVQAVLSFIFANLTEPLAAAEKLVEYISLKEGALNYNIYYQ